MSAAAPRPARPLPGATGSPPRVDGRVRRTRTALQAALAELATRDGYDTLTVESIAAHAQVGRATFYLHFTDKHDLLAAVADDLIGELLADLDRLQPHSHAVVARAAFRHAGSHRDAYRLLLSGAGDGVARQRILTLAAEYGERMIARIAVRRGTTLRLPLDLVARLWSVQLIGAIDWYVSGECPYDAEQMTAMLLAQRYHGLAWVYGYEPGDPRLAADEL